MRALFLVLHRKDRSPGQRYRHEQYLNYLQENGIECTISPLLATEKEDGIFYGNKVIPKIWIGLKALFRRFNSIRRAHTFDVVYIYRDAFFFGTFFENWLRRKKIKIIYDFDDAIWLMDQNPNQGIFNKLKNPKKTASICKIADRVIVGNEYLANYASKFNEDVAIIPSTINFDDYQFDKITNDKICIGWTGSFSTIKHFETVIPALEMLKEKYQDKIYFKVIGDPQYTHDALGIKGIKWQSETEAQDLSELAIGLMPLPDNEWTRGKCAMKGLQYMALGIPTIMSPVGVNADIISDGNNGYLASSTDEWVEKLSILIEDQVLREKVGKAGKKTVEEAYSVEANKEKWLRAFQF
ncbi:glycosyltransferase family 4 protein [Ekhidna sp.]|uniref:glycosyltransferase family 4 protein n=1 Tax=Ekhidna sp. TaxID=2608089 RepID=UPI003BAA753F